MSNGDPAVLEPRGKSNAARKGRYDGSYTGTEQSLKNKLMNQFRKSGEGPGGNSDAYRNASCWCECGRLKNEGGEECDRCAGVDSSVRYGGNVSNLDEFIRSLDPTISSEPLAKHLTASGPMLVMGVDRSPPEPFDADGSIFGRGR